MQTKAIKQKIKSVGGIKKITKTMEMVSAAKMKKAIDSAVLLRPFHSEAQNILKNISFDPLISHPLIKHNDVEEELLIIVASNKGLCGGYNTNVYRKLIEEYTDNRRKNLKVIAVGKFAEKIAKRLGLEVKASFITPTFSQGEARVLTKMIIEWYLNKEVGAVKILYTHFTSATIFTPTYVPLLPFESEVDIHNTKETLYTYEPGQGEVLTSIIPMMIHNIIYGVILEAYASEHSARMFAMKNATDSAGELQDNLKLYFNRARQAAVTQEISEIVSGAMAQSA